MGLTKSIYKYPLGHSSSSPGELGLANQPCCEPSLGVLPKESGEIYWNGEVVNDPKSFFVPPRCAYTPQVPRLFSEPLKDNILMGLSDDPEALNRAIRLGVMEEDLPTLEDGLDTVVGPRGVKLSGGQIQRAAATRMFIRPAELYVFDDLSSRARRRNRTSAVGSRL